MPTHKVMHSNAPHIMIKDAELRYHGADDAIFSALNMDFPAAKWSCILGQSGCGKSSLLRYLANLLEKKVHWSGQVSTQPSILLPRHIAYMDQKDLLMPWLTAVENVMLSDKFGLEKGSHSLKEALHLLQKVGLSDKANHLPQQLSGGMRQRVALARTLMQKKSIVLMDEPFSALDAITRYRLQNLAHELLKDKTVVLITHDPQEALRLADQLYVMHGKPALAEKITVPTLQAPREIDLECIALQQTIMTTLNQDI